MTRRAITKAAFAAIALGTLVAVLATGATALSVRVWFVVVAVALAWNLCSALITASQLNMRRGVDVVGWWRRYQRRAPRTDPSNLRAIEALLFRVRGNPRPHVRQLQPRLIALATHSLAVHHGLDLTTQADEAAELLGPVAWLIDPTVDTRAPSLDDIEQLLDRLEPPVSEPHR